MHFRVTDERDWQVAFDADTAAFLADGIRRACSAYRETGGSATIRLHVWGRIDTSPKGIWLTPSGNPIAPSVSPDVSDEWCEKWIAHAANMVRHHDALMGLGELVAEAAYGPPKPKQRGN